MSASKKGYYRKPAVVIVCALIYLLSPVGNFIWQWRLSGQGFVAFVSFLWDLCVFQRDSLTIANIALWLVAPFVALGIWRVNIAGWFLYLVYSVAQLALCLFGPGWVPSFGTAFFINLPFAAICLYFVFSEVRAPYFNPRLRWWLRHPRYRSYIHVLADGEEYSLFDLSVRGVFVATGGNVLAMPAARRGEKDGSADSAQAGTEPVDHAPGDRVKLRLLLEQVSLDLIVEVVRVIPKAASGQAQRGDYPPGFGARFLSLSAKDRAVIATEISRIRAKLEEKQTILAAG